MKPYFYIDKILSDSDLELLINKLDSKNTWNDESLTKNIGKLTTEAFKQFIKIIGDDCPICFNDLTENDKPNLLSCPCCKNYLHTECIEVWLEKNKTCVFCRSNCWEHYHFIK